MEMNPFTLDAEGKPFPLDMRGELDDTAAFKSGKKCALPSMHSRKSFFRPFSGPLQAVCDVLWLGCSRRVKGKAASLRHAVV